MNDFAECLAASHAAHDLPLWREIYEQSFPTMIAMHCHRKDGDHQRLGIDRSIVLENGKTILVDEKVRWRAYNDIAIEYAHRGPRYNDLGWVCKPLMCDYIAYAIAPLGTAYLFPVHALQAAWKKHSAEWFQVGRKIEAKNRGYVSLSLCLDPKVLFPAIGDILRPRFTPVEKISK